MRTTAKIITISFLGCFFLSQPAYAKAPYSNTKTYNEAFVKSARTAAKTCATAYQASATMSWETIQQTCINALSPVGNAYNNLSNKTAHDESLFHLYASVIVYTLLSAEINRNGGRVTNQVCDYADKFSKWSAKIGFTDGSEYNATIEKNRTTINKHILPKCKPSK